ncbi:MAG: ABC transporter substrate-binding protein, partial [Actinomycetota bacterium]
MTRRRSVFAGAVALLVTAVACGEAAEVGLEREEKVLGVLGTFSGAAAENTEAITRGVELAVDEYNDDPEGSFAVRMLKADTKGTGRGAATAAETLAGHDLLVGVVGPFVHGELAAAGPVLDAAQVPFVVPSVSDPALASSSFRRLIPNDRSAGQAAARAAVARIGEGGVAMFHDNNPQSVASAEGARVELEKAGIKISRIAVLGNPRRAARSLRDSPPAAVLSFGPGDRAGSFFAALAEVEFRGRFVGSGPGPDNA